MQPKGKVLWTDLTVENAREVSEFYGAVVGWTFSEQPVADYVDFNVHNGDEVIAGICHKKGTNANLPSQWLNYVIVPDMAESIKNVLALNGKVLDGPKPMGKDLIAVIQDPAGACMAIMQEN